MGVANPARPEVASAVLEDRVDPDRAGKLGAAAGSQDMAAVSRYVVDVHRLARARTPVEVRPPNTLRPRVDKRELVAPLGAYAREDQRLPPYEAVRPEPVVAVPREAPWRAAYYRVNVAPVARHRPNASIRRRARRLDGLTCERDAAVAPDRVAAPPIACVACATRRRDRRRRCRRTRRIPLRLSFLASAYASSVPSGASLQPRKSPVLRTSTVASSSWMSTLTSPSRRKTRRCRDSASHCAASPRLTNSSSSPIGVIV